MESVGLAWRCAFVVFICVLWVTVRGELYLQYACK